jgi:hypothetical protein
LLLNAFQPDLRYSLGTLADIHRADALRLTSGTRREWGSIGLTIVSMRQTAQPGSARDCRIGYTSIDEFPMPDKKLEILIFFAALFFLAHTVDHVARDLRWPLTAEAIPFLAFTALILATVFGAFLLYRRGKIGPRFLAVLGTVSVAIGWLGHFSPFTEQPLSHIFNAYQSPMAGWLAVGTLFALMLSLVAITIYSGMLWVRGSGRA